MPKPRFAVVFTLACLLLAPAWAAETASSSSPTNRAAAIQPDSEGYPVRLDGNVVLRVKSALGPITAEQRAELAHQRLLRIANDPFYSADLFRVTIEEEIAKLYYRDELVGVLGKEDVEGIDQNVGDTAARRISELTAAIRSYRERRTPRQLLTAGLLLAGATALALLLLWLTKRFYRRFTNHIERGESLLARKFNRRLGVTQEKIKEYRERLVRFLRAAFVVLIVIFWLEAVFAVVPITRGFARSVLSYLLQPLTTLWQGFLEHIGDLFFVLIVVVLTYYSLKGLRWIAREARLGVITLPGVQPHSAMPLYKILRLVVIAFAAMIAYPYIPGSSSAAFKGISLFAGALFTLGATGTAGNFIGGVMLVFMGHFRVGDRIRLGDVVGDVLEITLVVTRIRTPRNEVVNLPNAAVMSGQVLNYSARAQKEGLILHTAVSIGYDVAWRQVHELLLAAARKTEGVLDDPTPFVLQTALGDFYVNYDLNVYTREPEKMLQIYNKLHQNILDEFNHAGVQIMSPHYVGDPAAPKVAPSDSLQQSAPSQSTPG